MLRVAAAVVALLAALLVARFIHLSMTADPPGNLAAKSHSLAPCPESPNCVSSQAKRDSQRVEALIVEGDPQGALERVEAAIESMDRSRIVSAGDGYLHAEFKSAVFRFVDDLELVYDAELPGFQVRSASRVGYADMGTNRKRVEALRGLLG
ncbi:MAG: DUF1499 domain-containing protein [Thermoanaerobaculia bacterium]